MGGHQRIRTSAPSTTHQGRLEQLHSEKFSDLIDAIQADPSETECHSPHEVPFNFDGINTRCNLSDDFQSSQETSCSSSLRVNQQQMLNRNKTLANAFNNSATALHGNSNSICDGWVSKSEVDSSPISPSSTSLIKRQILSKLPDYRRLTSMALHRLEQKDPGERRLLFSLGEIRSEVASVANEFSGQLDEDWGLQVRRALSNTHLFTQNKSAKGLHFGRTQAKRQYSVRSGLRSSTTSLMDSPMRGNLAFKDADLFSSPTKSWSCQSVWKASPSKWIIHSLRKDARSNDCAGFGKLMILPHDVLLLILEFCEINALRCFGLASVACYVTSCADSVWQPIYASYKKSSADSSSEESELEPEDSHSTIIKSGHPVSMLGEYQAEMPFPTKFRRQCLSNVDFGSEMAPVTNAKETTWYLWSRNQISTL